MPAKTRRRSDDPPSTARPIPGSNRSRTGGLDRAPRTAMTPTTGMTIQAHQLTKRYGPVLAVDGLTFEVLPGRVTGFLGPNGAGKSTTMRLILGLDAPTAGTATLGGVAYRRPAAGQGREAGGGAAGGRTVRPAGSGAAGAAGRGAAADRWWRGRHAEHGLHRARPLGCHAWGDPAWHGQRLRSHPWDPWGVDRACAVIAGGQVVDVDLGVLEGVDEQGTEHEAGHFLNVASVGLGAAGAGAVSTRAKGLLGPLAYPVATLKAGASPRPFAARLGVGAKDPAAGPLEFDHVLQLAVGNGRFYGGGRAVSTTAGIDEGALDLYVVGRRGPWELLRVARRLRSGEFAGLGSVASYRTDQVLVKTDPPMAINVDGELRGQRTPVRITVARNALRCWSQPAPALPASTRSPRGDAPSPDRVAACGRPGACWDGAARGTDPAARGPHPDPRVDRDQRAGAGVALGAPRRAGAWRRGGCW